jgi:hypothetical protein
MAVNGALQTGEQMVLLSITLVVVVELSLVLVSAPSLKLFDGGM